MNSQDSLETRLVASPHWLWLPGMRCCFEDWDAPIRILATDETQAWAVHENADMPIAFPCELGSLHSPDLADPATYGCILALVEARYKDAIIYVMWWNTTGWTCCVCDDANEQGSIVTRYFAGATRMEAACHALLAP